MSLRILRQRVWGFLRKNPEFNYYSILMEFRGDLPYQSVRIYLRQLQNNGYLWVDSTAEKRGKLSVEAPRKLIKNTGVFSPIVSGGKLLDPNLEPDSHYLQQQIWIGLRQGHCSDFPTINKSFVSRYLYNLSRHELLSTRVPTKGKLEYLLINDLGEIAPEFVYGRLYDLNLY